MRKRIAVYTVIFGNYDSIKVPLHHTVILNEADLYCFTDEKELMSDVYHIINENPFPRNPRKSSRFFKTHGPSILKDYEYIVYCDGSIQIITDSLYSILSNILCDHDMAVFKHPYRNCIYAEGLTCIRRRLDNPKTIYSQLLKYKKLGFPAIFGLIESSAFVVKNTEEIRKKMHLWWKEIENGSIRDQISFDFIRWKYGIDVAFFPGNFQNSTYFRSHPHEKPRAHKDRFAQSCREAIKHVKKAVRGITAKTYFRKVEHFILGTP